MSGYRRWIGPLAVLATTVAAAAAAGLPVTYLMPDKFTAPAGGEVLLRVESGAPQAAQTVAWPADKLRWFFVRGDGTQENRDRVDATNPTRDAVAVKPPTPGVTVFGFDTQPVVSPVSGADLAEFLKSNVAGAKDDSAVQRLTERKTIRVRRIESATTMVRVPAGDVRDEHSAVAQAKTGQAVEIRPISDPTMLTVGSDFPLTVYIRGVARAGAEVQATGPAAAGTKAKTESKTADASGTTHFPIPKAGVWRIEFHHAEPLANDPGADWVVYSSTLTFEVGQGGAGK